MHYDGQATWDERLIPSAWHGVTTVVAGNCGVGFAPVRPADHDRLIELMEGVEDIPGAALHEGLPWTWQSFPEFLDALDGRHYDVDLATHVPHGALRLNVMGERGAQREMATPEDIEAMAALAREAVEAGAIGFSTSRTRNHRSSNGELTPTLTADADELLGIARAVGATGTGVLQVVSDFDDVDAEFGLFRSMAEASGRPLSFSLAGVDPQKYPRQLELLDEANAAGVRMRGQAAARAIGILVGLQCTVNPLAGNPVWQEIAGLSVAEQARAMAEPSFKERFLAAAAKPLGGADRMFELGDPPDYEPDPSTSIAARAAREGRSALDLAYDLFAQDEGRTFLYVPIINWFDGTLDGVGEMLAHQHTVPGLSDGGAHVGTICDASFPTTFLSYWGRDRDHGPARPRLPRAPAHQGHRRDRRPARPRRAGARLPGRRQPHRLRRPARAAARRCATTCRRAASGSCSGPTATTPRSSRGRSPTGAASPPTPSPVGCSAAPRRRRPDDGAHRPRGAAAPGASDDIGDSYVWELTDADRAELRGRPRARRGPHRAHARHHRRATSRCPPSARAWPRSPATSSRAGASPSSAGCPSTGSAPTGPRPSTGAWAATSGGPWPQNHKGHLLGDVTDQGKTGDDPTSRGNEIGGVAFPFHSDGSDLVGLFCLERRRRRRRQPRRQRRRHPQRARAHRARAGGGALRRVRLRLPRRGEGGEPALVPDAALHRAQGPSLRALHPALHPRGPAPRRCARAERGRRRGHGSRRRHVRRSRRSTSRCSSSRATCSS